MTRRQSIAAALAILAILSIAFRAVVTAAAEENSKEEVLKVEEIRNQALQSGDAVTLEKVYSDDLVYANASGALLTKQEHLAEFKARTLHFISFAHDNVEVTMHGDSAIITGISKSVVEYRGEVSHSHRRFVNIYAKKDGRWLCVGHFEQNLPEKTENH
jgi:ketosteroid isomerase-like protein